MSFPVPPDAMKCETSRCDHPPAAPVLKPDAINQSTCTLPGWVFSCPCGWVRTEPVKAEP